MARPQISTGRRRIRLRCRPIAVDLQLLVAIDNIQWLDHCSEMVLAFATRRLKAASACWRPSGVIPTVAKR